MNRLGKGLAASLAIGLIAFGLNPAVAVIDEMLSLSLGPDRPLEFQWVSDVKLSRDGRRVVAVTRDEVCVWDGDTGRRLLQVENDAGEHWLLDVDIDDAGRRIVTGAQFNRGYTMEPFRNTRILEGSLAKLWDADSGRLDRNFVMHEQRRFRHAAISRDGTRVACADDHQLDVKLWDAATGRELASVDGSPDSWAKSFAFSDDATRFAALGGRRGADDNRPAIHLGDLTSRRTRTIDPLPGEGSDYALAAISGDGREVVAWLGDAPPGRELALFDFETGKLRDQLPGPECRDICYLAFSPDGKTIALGKDDGRLSLIRRSNGVRVELRVSDGPVRAVAFLPNRVRIVAERKFVVNAERSGGAFAGPMRIADFAVLWPTL